MVSAKARNDGIIDVFGNGRQMGFCLSKQRTAQRKKMHPETKIPVSGRWTPAGVYDIAV